MACREYTLPRDDESSKPIGWIQGNTRILPVLEVTTSYLWGKYGIEIRIWSLSQDNPHSWVRISHGANKYVVDSNYKNTEVPADLPEEQASQSSVKVVAARSKAKAQPQKRETVELPSTIPMNERKWIDIEPAESSDISGTILYFRALQGHSGRSLIDPSLQDNVIIQCGLFHHMCF